MKNHPYADLFPMMTETELDALAEDIAANGLRQPIVTYQKAILDGRNRLVACKRAKVEPTFVEHEGDENSALALVISLNVQRRDLTAGQRAIVAARTWMTNADHKPGPKSPKSSAISLRSVAKQFKTSDHSILQARDLLVEAPDIAAQVATCMMSLATGHERLQEQRKQIAQMAKDAKRVAKYAEAISSGEMTLAEALQKVMEEEREEKEKIAAQADARSGWLKEFAAMIDWIKRFIAQDTDDQLAWYTEPESPGLFDHGITAEQVQTAIAQLQRTQLLTFGERNGRPKNHPGKKNRP